MQTDINTTNHKLLCTFLQCSVHSLSHGILNAKHPCQPKGAFQTYILHFLSNKLVKNSFSGSFCFACTFLWFVAKTIISVHNWLHIQAHYKHSHIYCCSVKSSQFDSNLCSWLTDFATGPIFLLRFAGLSNWNWKLLSLKVTTEGTVLHTSLHYWQ